MSSLQRAPVTPVRQQTLFKVAITASTDSICGTGPAYFKYVYVPVADISGWAHFIALNVNSGNMKMQVMGT